MGVTIKNTFVQIMSKSQTTLALIMLLGGSFLGCVSLNAAPLSLNGLVTYNNLTKDYYVAALYLPEIESDQKKILNLNQHKQMKLLVTANRWTPRAWTKQWQGNIAINNELPGKELQKSLEQFTGILKGNLLAGDLIMVDYVPAMGTKIFINQQLVLASSDMALFNALLATWVGKLPPSRDFKNRILSLASDQQTAADTQKLYTNVVPSERKDVIKRWLLTPGQIAKIEQKKRESALRSQLMKARLQTQQKAKIEQEQRLKQAVKKQAAQVILANQKRQAKKIVNQQERDRQKKYAKLKKEKESRLADAYYKDFYSWQLQKSIRDKITYPVWAREFNQEGIVDVLFTINAQGKIIGIEVDENKAPKLLISEVVKSIKSTSGQILPPSKLKGSDWKFSVNHSFNFRSKEQTILVPPTKPVHLS